MATGTGAPANVIAPSIDDEADRRMATLPAEFPYARWRLKYQCGRAGKIIDLTIRVNDDRQVMRAELAERLTDLDRRFGIWSR